MSWVDYVTNYEVFRCSEQVKRYFEKQENEIS